jgi:hypothetical protein
MCQELTLITTSSNRPDSDDFLQSAMSAAYSILQGQMATFSPSESNHQHENFIALCYESGLDSVYKG